MTAFINGQEGNTVAHKDVNKFPEDGMEIFQNETRISKTEIDTACSVDQPAGFRPSISSLQQQVASNHPPDCTGASDPLCFKGGHLCWGKYLSSDVLTILMLGRRLIMDEVDAIVRLLR